MQLTIYIYTDQGHFAIFTHICFIFSLFTTVRFEAATLSCRWNLTTAADNECQRHTSQSPTNTLLLLFRNFRAQ